MSRENVEVVREIYAAFARGDFDAALKHIHQDVEWVEPPGLVAGVQLWRGHEGVRRSVAQWVGSWDDYRFDLQELRTCGDQVLDGGKQRGRGRTSGVEVEEPLFHVWTFRDRKVVRQRMFRDRAEALEAVGLAD